MHRPPRPAGHEALCDLIVELTARIRRLEVDARARGDRLATLNFSDEKLATVAESMYRARIQRANQFSPKLFGEPAWDMLLDLFIHKASGRRISTTSLCLGANTPQATGLRYIALLEKEDLIRRVTSPDDGRLMIIELTRDGYCKMRDYISAYVTRFNTPLPD